MLRHGYRLASVMLLAMASQSAALEHAARYEKVHKIAVGGEGGWDYLTVDPEARRLYVSRGNRVVVLDLDKEAVVGELADTPGVHGIAVVPELGKGFTSNGGDGTRDGLRPQDPEGDRQDQGQRHARRDPLRPGERAGLHLQPRHRRRDRRSTRPATPWPARSPLGGEPEAAVADGKGHVFVNIRSKSEVAEFDATHAQGPQPLAARPRHAGRRAWRSTRKNRRLFSVCGNQKMVVMDADKGTILASADIGRGSDGCVFDPAKGLAYSSNGGDGTVTAVGEGEPGQFKVVATIPTQASARTMALDPKTHRLYLSAATAGPPPPAPAEGQPKTKGRRELRPGLLRRSSSSATDRDPGP